MRRKKIRIVLPPILFTACLILSAPLFADEAPKPDSTAVKHSADAKPLNAAGESKDAADKAAQDEQSSYVYDLKKLIEKSKDNIKRVNEKIQEQAIYKRNQLREEKAREYYERAIQLFEEGKPQEAREYWEKSIKITEHPEMKDYIKDSEKRFKLQTDALKKEERDRQVRTIEDQKARDQQVQETYNTAVTLYKQKKYKPARDEFMLVEQLMPEYKATRSYLKLLEQNIAVQDKEDLKNQQKEIARQQQEAEDARIREKELWRKEIDLKEQERRSKLSKQAQDVYAQALALYKKKDFIGAKEKFQEVEWVIPDYKATRKYLDMLDAEIKKHEEEYVAKKEKERQQKDWQNELARRKKDSEQKKENEQKEEDQKRRDLQEAEVQYQAGIKLLMEKKYQESRDAFVAVQKIYPNYKATEEYIARLNGKLGIIETAPEKVGEDVKTIYADAVRSYKERDYAVAKQKFERVEFLYPNYESTRRFLSKMDKNYDFKKTEALKDDVLIKEEPKADQQKTAANPPANSKEYETLVEKVEPMYANALKLYDEKKYDESLKEFQSLDAILSNYKSTRPYIKRITQQLKKIEQQKYKEEQFKQAEIINALAKQANTLFVKIQQLADDSLTASAKRKFAMIDRLFANMSKEQAKLLEEILEEEKKLKLEEIAYEQEVQKSEFASLIDPIYEEAVKLYESKRYDEAKSKFLEAQTKIADYRSSNRYLALIEKQNRLMSQLMADRESRIKEFQVKADESAKLQAKQELEVKEQGMIRDLVTRASAINDEIITLSKDRNFEVIKTKFAELEKIVDNLLTIKTTIAEREARERRPQEKKAEPSPAAKPHKEFNPPLRKGRAKAYDKVPLRREPAASTDTQVQQQAPTPELRKEPALGPAVEPVVPVPAPVQGVVDADAAAIEHITAAQTVQALAAGKNKAEQEQQQRITDKEDRDLYLSAIKDFDNRRFSEAKAKFVALEQNERYAKSAHQFSDKIDSILVTEQKKVAAEENKKKEEELKAQQERAQERTQAATKVAEAKSQKAIDTRVRQEKAARVPVRVLARPAVHRDYLSSLDLRVRRPVESLTANENQVAEMKDIAPVEKMEAKPSPVKEAAKKKIAVKKSKPVVTQNTSRVVEDPGAQPPENSKAANAAAGVSPNEDASWLQRRKQKALSAKRKKYLEQQYKAAQKEKEQEARQKNENQQQLLAMAKVEKTPVPGEAAVSDDPVLRRQQQLEQKNRAFYERALRRQPPESGLNKAVMAADLEDKKKAREEARRREDFIRQRKEEDLLERRDKERQVAIRLGQGQEGDMAPKTDLSDLRAARLNKNHSVKPNGNPELQPKPELVPRRADKSKPATPAKAPAVVEIEAPPVHVSPASSKSADIPEASQRALPAEEPQTKRQRSKPSPSQAKLAQEQIRAARAEERAAKSQAKAEARAADAKAKAEVKARLAEAKARAAEAKRAANAKPAPAPKPVKTSEQIEQERLRREFENGIDTMYREAITFYKGGLYNEARQKFAAVEDLSPDYKRTRNYIQRSDDEILKDQKRHSKIKEAKITQPAQTLPKPGRNDDVPPAPTKDEAVASALDLFDTQK